MTNQNKPATGIAPSPLGIRINRETLSRIQEVHRQLRDRSPGAPWTQTSVVRYLLDRGLDSFFYEHGGE